MTAFEVNFDGLVGPTHNYSGLSAGNVASMAHGQQVSNPKEAAKQGLAKIALLRRLGSHQAVLPPQERPSIPHLRKLGFYGTDAQIIEAAAKSAPWILHACSSASSMWTANAATVAPSMDTQDGKVHVVPANLVSKLHRSIETEATGQILKTIFANSQFFTHHDALTACDALGDEGAANHTRLTPEHSKRGLHLFVYGRLGATGGERPSRFPARQTRQACEALVRLHRLPEQQVVFAQQLPYAIDSGVFHNDVISVGSESVFFFHECSFLNQEKILEELKRKWEALNSENLHLIQVTQDQVGLEDVVRSYLFNSQLIRTTEGLCLIAPQECELNSAVRTYLDGLVRTGPIRKVVFVQMRESMKNGGGPACLRLRVVLTPEQRAACAPGVFIDDSKQLALENWVGKHYRDRLVPADLADPKLLVESRTALDELTQILGLGSFYPFQKTNAR